MERLAFTGAAKDLGLRLEEVSVLLPVWESGACADVKAGLRPRIAEHASEARARAGSVLHLEVRAPNEGAELLTDLFGPGD